MAKRIAILFSLVFVALLLQACSKEESSMTSTPNISDPDPDNSQPLCYLALGDSYTIGQSVDENERWPVQLVQALIEKGEDITEPEIIAQTGWTTDELKQGIEARNPQGPYDLVSLLIGVNNQYRGLDTADFRLELRELLQISINFAGKDTGRVIVVSIPDYGVTPFAQNMNPEQIAKEIDAFNAIKEQETMRAGVVFIDITPISRLAADDPSLLAEDGLHPSGKMYASWLGQILPWTEKILDNIGKQKP